MSDDITWIAAVRHAQQFVESRGLYLIVETEADSYHASKGDWRAAREWLFQCDYREASVWFFRSAEDADTEDYSQAMLSNFVWFEDDTIGFAFDECLAELFTCEMLPAGHWLRPE